MQKDSRQPETGRGRKAPREGACQNGRQRESGLNLNAEAIQSEYRRLDSHWRRLQYRACIWMALCTLATEVLMFFVLHSMDFISTTTHRYLLKYLLTPLLLHGLLLVCTGYLVDGSFSPFLYFRF